MGIISRGTGSVVPLESGKALLTKQISSDLVNEWETTSQNSDGIDSKSGVKDNCDKRDPRGGDPD